MLLSLTTVFTFRLLEPNLFLVSLNQMGAPMLAAVLRNTGDQDLDVTDTIEVNDPGPDDVVVKITHTGVCHSDVSAMNGTIPTECPAVLGHEGAGIIDSVGDNVTEVAVGDHVIVVWSPPCGGCRFCIDHKSPNSVSYTHLTLPTIYSV